MRIAEWVDPVYGLGNTTIPEEVKNARNTDMDNLEGPREKWPTMVDDLIDI
jgi:hypothetical protein